MVGEFFFGKTFGSWITHFVMIQDGTGTWSNVRINLVLLWLIIGRISCGWISNSMDHNLAKLSKCLHAFFLNHKEDDLIWKTDPSGIFSIASAYANSFDVHDEPYWAKAWVKHMTPKVNIFFWILL